MIIVINSKCFHGLLFQYAAAGLVDKFREKLQKFEIRFGILLYRWRRYL